MINCEKTRFSTIDFRCLRECPYRIEGIERISNLEICNVICNVTYRDGDINGLVLSKTMKALGRFLNRRFGGLSLRSQCRADSSRCFATIRMHSFSSLQPYFNARSPCPGSRISGFTFSKRLIREFR